MKVNDIVVLKNTNGDRNKILELSKHLFEIVKIDNDIVRIKSLSTEVEIAVELEGIRLATLKEIYLVDGNSVIFDDKEYYVAGKRLIGRDNYMMLKDIDDNLNFYNGVDKIDKVIKLFRHHLGGDIIWQRTPKIELTDDEKVILHNLDNDRYKYITRSEYGGLRLGFRMNRGVYVSFNGYDNLFKTITHESGVHEIKDLLE